jgi:serine phosphatase RsbU (regulator of sigma subunit)
MTERPRRLLLPAAREAPATGSVRFPAWLVRTWRGRALLTGLAVLLLDLLGLLPKGLAGLGTLARVALVVAAVWVLGRFTSRRLLWRIRTKLIVSYLFIAVVPVVLLLALFGLVGLIGMSLVTSYMVSVNVERDAQELELAARTTLAGLRAASAGREREAGAVPAEVTRRLGELKARYPGLSYAWVRDGRTVAAEGDAPTTLPAWLEGSGFGGAVEAGSRRALRGIASAEGSFLLLEVPLDRRLYADLERRTGLHVFGEEHPEGHGQGITIRRDPRKDTGTGSASSAPAAPSTATPAPAVTDSPSSGLNSVALISVRDWTTGEVGLRSLAIRFLPRALLSRLAPTSSDVPAVLVTAVAVVACTFLVLDSVALVLGLLLARSITRSIHALSQGTERLRQGDFSRPIPIQTRDQLGDLAESFNIMARGLEDLLREQAEKERLEEELRIARQIQMSLLPAAAVGLAGIGVAARCLPAEEVGGDYYDLLPLCDTRLGVLVADVSGKGTSAALYMAELKGLVLSLSRNFDSPARLLGEANRILAANLDPRSFITMTYAVVDTAARTMRYARAGHNPILHFEAEGSRARSLAPPGLGLGMDAGARFEAVLREETVPLRKGDVFLFFTDGLSEAMNERDELFGETRLREALERAATANGGDPDALRDHILDDVQRFVGLAAPHDDMTLVVLKVA